MAAALPTPQDCCTSCTTPVQVNVPGTAGAAGAAGADGTNGLNAFSKISGNGYVIPASGATSGDVFFTSTDWMGVGQVIFIEGYGYFQVITRDATNKKATIKNLGYPGNDAGGGNFADLSPVGPGGLQGNAGPAPGGALLAANKLGDLPAPLSDSRTNLGLGTMATQAASAVTITGGVISGITDLAVADGGTGASVAATARTNLGAAASGVATGSGLTVSATDMVLGRSSAGPGAIEEIACTATGRSIIAAASITAAKSLLGIGTLNVVSKAAGYTASSTDDVILCDATGAPFTVALPTAVGITGKVYTVKRVNAGGNAVTVDPNGGETVDGAATYALSAQWNSISVISDGAGWQIISKV